MLILGIDTSGKSGGVTLAEGDETAFKVVASAPIAGGTFSAQLVPTVAALLRQHGFAAKDLGGFAVASGPGSFTGLRIGLSAVKGLAEILHKPIATVSVLEALASMSETHGDVLAALDAGRNEVFLGRYAANRHIKAASSPQERLCTRDELLAEINSNASAAVITCDESIAQAVAATQAPLQRVARPDSAVIARLGLRKLLAGDTVSAEALDANYLRRSDAEIFHKGNR